MIRIKTPIRSILTALAAAVLIAATLHGPAAAETATWCNGEQIEVGMLKPAVESALGPAIAWTDQGISREYDQTGPGRYRIRDRHITDWYWECDGSMIYQFTFADSLLINIESRGDLDAEELRAAAVK